MDMGHLLLKQGNIANKNKEEIMVKFLF